MVIGLIVLIFSGNSLAQDDRCGTVEYNRFLDSIYPQRQSERNFEKWLLEKKEKQNEARIFTSARKKSLYIIPVVVHVIHNGEPIGEGTNISDEQVISQIEVLNEDYRRLNPDTTDTPDIFKPVAVDPGIEFRLATRDPSGNATTGIVRVQGSKTSWHYVSDDVALKSQSLWPPEDYLNIWVCDLSSDLLGYGQYPVTDLPGTEPPYDRETDGVAIDYEAFGSVIKGSFPQIRAFYDRGRSATHEIGHFLSLKHIWGDESGCSSDDYCNDTPLQAESYFSCADLNHPVSCGSEDMYQNYMDYSYDRCMNIFTGDQADRMRIVLENSPRRASLLTSPGLLPPASIYNNIALISVPYPANISCNNLPQPRIGIRNLGINKINSLTIMLSLDGLPADTAKISQVLNEGEYKEVSLNALDLDDGQHILNFEVLDVNDSADLDNTNNELTKVILVNAIRDLAPVRNQFPSEDIAENGWSVYNPDMDMTWEIASVPVSFKPNRSAVIRYYDYETLNELDWLVSPVLDFSDAVVARMGFSFSYANVQGKNDFLQVKVSTDCGETFPFTIFEGGGNLLAETSSPNPWVPDSKDDWFRKSINMDQFSGYNNVRVAFMGYNGNGNNIYVDDIEFYTTGYSSRFDMAENSVRIFPNPVTSGILFVTMKTNEKQRVTLTVCDSMGKIIFRKDLMGVLNQTYEIGMANQPPGVYVVHARGENFSYSRKAIVPR